MKDSKEEKAKEYADQFKVEGAPIGSFIEMSKATKHFKAGFEAGRHEETKEIVKLRLNFSRMKGEFIGTLKAMQDCVSDLTVLKIITDKITELENLLK